MKTIRSIAFSLALLAVFLALPAHAQTVLPNTTLCGAVTSTTVTNVCLTSTTGVVNQTGIFVDQEYMTVNLSNNQTLAASNAIVPVTRGNRAAGSGPALHANAAIAWIALTPGQSIVPGANGFSFGTTPMDVGPCTRANITYLPHIFPNLGVARDCNQNTTTTAGVWVNYNVNSSFRPSSTPVVPLTTNGAIVPTSGVYNITKAGVLADTLAAPTAGIQDGAIIVLTSSTANAHTLTATGLLQTGTASVNLATFAAQAGAGLTLMAYNGKWIVLASVGITFS